MPRRCLVLLGALLALGSAPCVAADLSPFESHRDIGAVGKPGAVRHEAGVFRVTGGGTNMWGEADAFHFVYTKMTGDVSLSADVRLVGDGGDPHRKACLLLRQSLDAGSPYADAALHGDGLVSLQYRQTPAGPTQEIQANSRAPARLRIEKRGRYVSMSIAGQGAALSPAGGSIRLELEEPFYVGLGVCAHDNSRLETAEFSNVTIESQPSESATPNVLHSTLETIDIASTDRRVVHHTRSHIEAPNWTPDGAALIYNSEGRLYRIPVTGGAPEEIDTGFAKRCNNDHGVSPDGSQLVISDQTDENWLSRIYVLPIEGVKPGEKPRLVTPNAPSYWHGWSPDGKTLAYCAERDGEFDIYTIPARGGEETRLTDSPGLDDGPDYSADGRWIYFNSQRTGSMHVWRMRTDGSEQEQLTFDDRQNWFPHPSPDGRWVVYLSYEPDVEGHPPNQDVELRLMPIDGGEPRTIATLFGGQGTINVPSWSPDSRRFAFVSYQFRTD